MLHEAVARRSDGTAAVVILSSTFAIFWSPCVNGVDNKKDSSPCLVPRRTSLWKGVRDAVAAQVGGAASGPVLYSIHPPHVPACPGPVRRLHADAGPPHRHPRPLDRPGGGRRSPHRLPPRPLPRPLVALAAGRGAGGDGGGAGARGEAGGAGGGRRGGGAPGQARVRQGPPPRPLPLHPQPEGGAVGVAVGGA